MGGGVEGVGVGFFGVGGLEEGLSGRKRIRQWKGNFRERAERRMRGEGLTASSSGE